MKNGYRGMGSIRLARLLKGLTMRQVGRLLNPPRSIAFVHRVENYGPATITREVAEQFATLLDSSVEELFTTK